MQIMIQMSAMMKQQRCLECIRDEDIYRYTYSCLGSINAPKLSGKVKELLLDMENKILYSTASIQKITTYVASRETLYGWEYMGKVFWDILIKKRQILEFKKCMRYMRLVKRQVFHPSAEFQRPPI